MTNIANLSPEAKSALMGANVSRRGATLPTTVKSAVKVELTRAGLIGAGDGLTDRGVIARDRLVAAALDAAF